MVNTFLDFLKDNISTETWIPEIYRELIGLSAISVVSRGRFCVQHSKRIYYPNLYTLFVGDSGVGKGVAIHDCLEKLIGEIDHSMLLPKTFTPEGLLTTLTEQNTGIVCNDEIGNILSSKKYMTGTAEILTEIYNVPEEYSRKLVKKMYYVRKPYLCLALGTQMETMEKIMDSALVTSGFLPRFLITYATRSEYKEPVKDMWCWHYAMHELYNLYQVTNVVGAEIPTESYVGQCIYRFVRDKMEEVSEEGMGALCHGRLADHLFKLSLLYYLNDNIGRLYGIYKDRIYVYNVDNVNRVYNINNVNSVCTVSNVIGNNKGDTYPKNPKNGTLRASSTGNPDSLLYTDTSTLLTDMPKTVLTFPTLSMEHLRKAVRLINKLDAGYLTCIKRWCASTDMKILTKVTEVIKRLTEDGKTEKYGIEIAIHNRHILRFVGTTNEKLKPYLSILREQGIIKHTIMKDRKILHIIDRDILEGKGD